MAVWLALAPFPPCIGPGVPERLHDALAAAKSI